MPATRLSSKGQVVLPKPVRDALHWPEGTDLEILQGEDSVTLRRKIPPRRLPTSEEVDRVAGCLKYNEPPKTLEDIDRELTESFRREWQK